MKKVFKKIGIILAITICVLLFVGFVGIAYLFLVPNSSLLGVSYVSNKTSKYYQLGKYDSYTKPINQMVVNTKQYGINVVVDKDADNLQVYMKNDVAGLVKKKNSTTDLVYSYDYINKAINISTKEITGLVGYGNSYIEVIFPKNVVTESLKIKLSAGNDADISINGVKEVKIDTLNVSAWRGAINIDNIEMRALNLNVSKSKVVIGENVGNQIEYAKLDIGNSNVSFLKAGGGEKEILNARKEDREININNVQFNITKLEVSSMKKDGSVKLIKCNELCSSAYPINRVYGGEIECWYISSLLQFSTTNCDITIKDIGGIDTGSVYDANGNGCFNLVGKSSGNLSIKSSSGKINVNQVLGVGDFQTQSGDINIKNATKSLQLVSQTGNITAKFGDNVAESMGDGSPFRRVSLLRVKNSKVNIVGLNVINAVVENGGNAEIKLNYKKVINSNTFDIKSGNLLAIVPTDNPLRINVDSVNSWLNCHVGSATYQASKLNGNFDKIVYTQLSMVDGVLDIDVDGGSVSLYSDDVYGV